MGKIVDCGEHPLSCRGSFCINITKKPRKRKRNEENVLANYEHLSKTSKNKAGSNTSLEIQVNHSKSVAKPTQLKWNQESPSRAAQKPNKPSPRKTNAPQKHDLSNSSPPHPDPLSSSSLWEGVDWPLVSGNWFRYWFLGGSIVLFSCCLAGFFLVSLRFSWAVLIFFSSTRVF